MEDKYKIISSLIEDWLPGYGDWFTREDVWRHITGQGVALTTEGKKNVAKFLGRETEKGAIRKRGKKYRYVDTSTVRFSNPFDCEDGDLVHILHPSSHNDGELTAFGFEDTINLHKGDAMVVSGESNEGKSTYVLNILADNMDYHKIRFISTEMTPSKFKGRVKVMDWVKPMNGTMPKFEFGFMDGDNYEDVIDPDMVNIIDWVGLRGDFWVIQNIIGDMKARLRDGVVILVLQHKKGEDNPVGGEFAYRRADACLSISRGVLKVLKVKDYNQPNPNYRKFAFDINGAGCRFENIREVDDCPQCKGRKYYGGGKCSKCYGKGYVEKDSDGFI